MKKCYSGQSTYFAVNHLDMDYFFGESFEVLGTLSQIFFQIQTLRKGKDCCIVCFEIIGRKSTNCATVLYL